MNLAKIYDPIRQIHVKANPEEIIRQALLQKMIKSLGYPKSLIAVEKDLGSLEHLQKSKIKIDRRADIICFANNLHPEYMLYPLLMIECKKGNLNQKAIDQILGYNYHIKSYFIALANGEQIKTLWQNDKGVNSCNFLPPYSELIRAICKK